MADIFKAADAATVARRHEQMKPAIKRRISELIIKIRTLIDDLNNGRGDIEEFWDFRQLIDELKSDCSVFKNEAEMERQGISQTINHLIELNRKLEDRICNFVTELGNDMALFNLIDEVNQMHDRFL